MTTSKTNNPPVDEIRDGLLTIAIWKNETEHGYRYSAGSIVRSYKDDQDQWKETGYLSNGDILKASRLLDTAYGRILELKAKDKAESAGEPQ